MSHIRDHQGQLDNLDDVSSYLKSNGFTENEISSAYSWVLDQIQSDSQFLLNNADSDGSFRILSDQERRIFTTEALGYMLQLNYLGLINNSQMELILDRGSLLGSTPIDLEQLKLIIGSMLFREFDDIEIGKQPIYIMPDIEDSIN
jgi:Smg protein